MRGLRLQVWSSGLRFAAWLQGREVDFRSCPLQKIPSSTSEYKHHMGTMLERYGHARGFCYGVCMNTLWNIPSDLGSGSNDVRTEPFRARVGFEA